MSERKAFSLLGLAQKARAAAAGNFAVEQAVRAGTAKIVIVASDASPNALRDISRITHYYNFPLVRFGTKETLGHALGRQDRVTVAILADGLAEAFRKELTEDASVTEVI